MTALSEFLELRKNFQPTILKLTHILEKQGLYQILLKKKLFS
jgi:hypothetical protein